MEDRFERMKHRVKDLELVRVHSPYFSDPEVCRRGKAFIPHNLCEKAFACTIGHFNAIVEFLKSGETFGIIAEDDVIFHKFFKGYIACVIDYMNNRNIDVVSVGFVNIPQGARETFSGITYIENVGIGNPFGTQCYILTRTYAQKFIDMFGTDEKLNMYKGWSVVSDGIIFDPQFCKRSTLLTPIAVEDRQEKSIIGHTNKFDFFSVLNRRDFFIE